MISSIYLWWPDRQTDGQNIYRIDDHIREECAQQKIITLSQLRAERIAFPPKPDRHTDGHK